MKNCISAEIWWPLSVTLGKEHCHSLDTAKN